VEVEENPGPPRGLLLGIAVIGIVVAAAIAGVFAFKLQPGLGGGAAGADTVLMPVGVGSDTSLNFSPVTITVIIGQNNTVTFVNKDSTVHTVTANDGSFDSGNIEAGASWTYTFSTPGNFTYHCVYHHWMVGTVVVLPSGTSSSSTSTQSNSTSTA